ncbi:MAG: 1,6-anhydro-N-acetylmuramyl-L-alanine amidase AmpD [Gammaproteobacteria bacterium]|nr:1,6-anhydro-N-acetylmuramyl-L-alanine amidase AmpD [Gammaproteobacteria bacterium]MCY4295826.1 1,6-anhydro-N-acetylmuramyl-L-alanine amidase AmpD [Gammaproteobacteria bacterium]
MLFQAQKGLLTNCKQVASPNRSARPGGEIELLVIHNISLPAGEFGTGCVERLFTNCLPADGHPSFAEIARLRVSSHLLIDRAGVATQFVPFTMQAWHAGESSFRGRERCNEFSIGIELEGTDFQPFTDAQYETLAAVTKALFRAYPGLNVDRIAGHSEIAPGRKTDPGPHFDWERYRAALGSANHVGAVQVENAGEAKA